MLRELNRNQTKFWKNNKHFYQFYLYLAMQPPGLFSSAPDAFKMRIVNILFVGTTLVFYIISDVLPDREPLGSKHIGVIKEHVVF